MRRGITILTIFLVSSRVVTWFESRSRAWHLCGEQLHAGKRVTPRNVTGILGPPGERSREVWFPRVDHGTASEPVLGRVRVPWVDEEGGANTGLEVRISGPFRCAPPLKNFSVQADGDLELRLPRFSFGTKSKMLITGESSWFFRSYAFMYRRFFERLAPYPKLRAVAEATWLGKTDHLDPPLISFFRDAGILAVLAISGQHVTILMAVIQFFHRTLLTCCPGWVLCYRRQKSAEQVVRCLPLFISSLLLCTSLFQPSVVRTFAMCTSIFVLRSMRLESNVYQTIATCAAIVIAISPQQLANPGFFLSATTTGILVHVNAYEPRATLLKLIWVNAMMAVSVWPLSAYFFSKVSLASFLHAFFVGGVWELVVIPMGFLFPFAPIAIMPLGERWLETLLQGIQLWQVSVPTGLMTVVRPTLLETTILEFLLCVTTVYCSVFIDRFCEKK